MIKEYKGELFFIALAVGLYVVFAIFQAAHNFVYLSPIFGLFGLAIAWKVYEYVDDQPEGNEKMVEIAESIHEGAMVFLSREYRILAYFVGGVFILLVVFIGQQQGIWVGIWTGVAYLLGAACSMAAGFFGMNAATTANVRTAQAANDSGQAKALDVAFNGGAVMGLCVASLGLMGVGGLFLLFGRGDHPGGSGLRQQEPQSKRHHISPPIS